MKHYTYLLIDPETEMKYVGMRTCECEVDEDPYMGSSYAMTSEDRNRCDKIVLEVFNTREEALAHEIYIHNLYEVHTNPEFWNLAKQTSTKFVSNRKGCKLTEEHKRKCSEALKGRKMKPFTEEHKRKISEARKGTKASPELKAKLSEQRQGELNSNFKHNTIYKWVHKDGREFVGRPMDLHKAHNVSDTTIYKQIRGKSSYACGWALVVNVDTGCMTTSVDVDYITPKRWVHESGEVFVGTVAQLQKKIGAKFSNTIKKVIRGRYKSTLGWSIEA
jgi:hypothetical protein